MKQFNEFIESVKGRKLTITDKGAIKQTERNALKSETLENFMSLIPSDLVVGRAKEGIIIELPNDNEGALPIVLDIKFKNVDFDTQTPVTDYAKAQEDKKRKAKEKAEKTARARAEREAKKSE